MTKEAFKSFIRGKPELASYVTNGDMTWQKFYELYDIYGEDETIWNKYTNKTTTKITDVLNKFSPDNFQKHLETAQKALDIFSEFANKGAENIANNVKPNIERPLSKFFGD
jgi:hypothetical protein